jgi:hypothetical protein
VHEFGGAKRLRRGIASFKHTAIRTRRTSTLV